MLPPTLYVAVPPSPPPPPQETTTPARTVDAIKPVKAFRMFITISFGVSCNAG
jgi:hypothetical protein